MLEASPLPKIPVTGLESIDTPGSSFRISLDQQSEEEEEINGSNDIVRYNGEASRYPLVLVADGIVRDRWFRFED